VQRLAGREAERLEGTLDIAAIRVEFFPEMVMSLRAIFAVCIS
jgi:hypothetical protein